MLRSKTPLLVVQNVFNSLFGLVGVFFITRFYPVSWGILSFAIGFVGLFSFLSDLGYSTAYVRFLSSGMDEGKANSNILAIKMVKVKTTGCKVSPEKLDDYLVYIGIY